MQHTGGLTHITYSPWKISRLTIQPYSLETLGTYKWHYFQMSVSLLQLLRYFYIRYPLQTCELYLKSDRSSWSDQYTSFCPKPIGENMFLSKKICCLRSGSENCIQESLPEPKNTKLDYLLRDAEFYKLTWVTICQSLNKLHLYAL